MDRPALRKLLSDVEAEKIDVIVVYKVDRLTRSLADFAKLVELFDAHNVSFVSVTQSFNTTTSMGRLTRDRRAEIRALIDRVTVETTMIRIALSVHAAEEGEADTLSLPWTVVISSCPSHNSGMSFP